MRVLRVALLLAPVVVGLATGCREHDAASGALTASPARASCEAEARQLTESAALYSATDTGAAPAATLASGRFVYRCEERGDWLGVMYPAIGEKVDCATRRTDRACALGWIRRDTHMAIFG
jgi:hypothetical protein